MFRALAKVVLAASLILPTAAPVIAGDRALTVYAGRVTEDHWFEALPPGVHFADAWILVTALSWTVEEAKEGALTFEIEGQAAKYFGDQDNLEFNLALVARWHRFWWDDKVDTSLAFGMGPSWATEKPQVEEEINGTTERFLVHWFSELALGPPGGRWAAVFRLHHRSDAFGLVAEEGGSNTLGLGVKFFFE